MENRNIHTFIACDKEYEESRIVIFGAPYDCTASYRPGARFAPAAIRNESYGIETYSMYQNKDLEDTKVFDGGDLELPFGNPEPVLDIIEKYTKGIIEDGKIPFMVGGEHLVTLGAVRAAVSKYENLHIIHFDAHADLRQSYLGTELSHASVIRRCHELTGDGRIFQFGIRSGDRQEVEWGSSHVETCRFNFKTLDNVIDSLRNVPVYFTIDLDVLDPSELPGTGTPEAGGVTYSELADAAGKVSKLNIVGMDMVELSPPYDHSGISTALACKLMRELLLYLSDG